MFAQDGHTGADGTRGMVTAGGVSLVGGAFAFLLVFSYLAARFNYPGVLDGEAHSVLPALLATGAEGRMVWALYGLLPLIFLPAGVAVFEALRARAEAQVRLGMLFATMAAICMALGLMRWPSIHWELARAWTTADASERVALAAIFNGLNSFLGRYIGEFLGELSFSIFFVLTGLGLLRQVSTPRWMGWWGIATGVLGLVGMWRNVTPAVSLVADLNNYLLPAWMIGLGVWLIRNNRSAHPEHT